MKANIIGKILVGAACLISLFNVCDYVKAAATTKTISLPSASGVNTYTSVNRNSDYSYIRVRLNSLYPTVGGTDSYTYVICGVYTTGLTDISKASCTVSETSASYVNVHIKEGYLTTNPVNLSLKHVYVSNTKVLSANITIEDMR